MCHGIGIIKHVPRLWKNLWRWNGPDPLSYHLLLLLLPSYASTSTPLYHFRTNPGIGLAVADCCLNNSDAEVNSIDIGKRILSGVLLTVVIFGVEGGGRFFLSFFLLARDDSDLYNQPGRSSSSVSCENELLMTVISTYLVSKIWCYYECEAVYFCYGSAEYRYCVVGFFAIGDDDMTYYVKYRQISKNN